MTDLTTHPCPLYIYPKGKDMLTLKGILLKGRFLSLIRELCDYTYSPTSPLSLNFAFCVHCNFICLISFQNHILNGIKIH